MTQPTTATVRVTVAPVNLADAKVGDAVIVIVAPFMRNGTGRPTFKFGYVSHATPKRLRVNGTVYHRTGYGLRRDTRNRLADPTPERLEKLAAAQRAAEVNEQARANDESDSRINRRIAADWLAHQTDPDEIERLLFHHTLEDVFDVLRKARIV